MSIFRSYVEDLIPLLPTVFVGVSAVAVAVQKAREAASRHAR